ncbi:MAG TPA: hypothetical protein VFU36_08855, partial [Jatrophihabitans sp.]|nr:hypothetical protein [Jatrophihabitans sp.]
MSTDQTTPPPAGATLAPASATLPGSAEVTGPDERDGHVGHPASGGLNDAPEEPACSMTTTSATTSATSTVRTAVSPADSSGTGLAEAGRPVGSSWQAEASGELVAMSFPGARRIAGWLFWVVFPLLCIGAIHASVTKVVHHLGNKPVGIRGTFVVQPRSCNQGFCSFGGLFTSDDRTIRSLPLLGDPRWHTAEVHKVTYDPRSVEVTPLPGHWNPTPS